MKINELIPFNGKTIQTKILKELGYSTKDINKLISDGVITRVRRGYYEVSLNYEVDINLMKYYLRNSYFDELIEYFDNLPLKDYSAYYYRFMCDIMTNDYANAYDHLEKCCELNNEEHNKFNLYAYLLLLDELIKLPKDKLSHLKKILFNKNYKIDIFLECLINKEYEKACKNLRYIKDDGLLDKVEINVLRNLSIKASNNYNKKNSKELMEYNDLFEQLYIVLNNSDFERAYYIFNRILVLDKNMDLKENKVKIIKDLMECFNYIVEHPNIDLNTYKTKYTYGSDIKDNFTLSIKRNDYIKALEFCNKLYISEPSKELEMYKILLERIYNFLNIRAIINSRNPYFNQVSLSGLVKEKKYEEALSYVNNNNIIEEHSKNIVTSLLESLLSIDNINLSQLEN